MEVNLVTITSEKVPVIDANNLRLSSMCGVKSIVNSNDVVPLEFVQDINIPIKYWREHTRQGETETALAIHPDVERILLKLKVPELVESMDREQQRVINSLKYVNKQQVMTLDKTIVAHEVGIHKIFTATWWQRLKWVFTGVTHVK